MLRMIVLTSSCQGARSRRHSSVVPGSVQDSTRQSSRSIARDEIQDFAAPQRIGDDMAADADPVVADELPLMLRQSLHRHQATPDHDAGELGPAVAEHLLADSGMHAIGADQHIAGRGFAVRQTDAWRCPHPVRTDTGIAGLDRVRIGLRTASSSTAWKSPRCTIQ